MGSAWHKRSEKTRREWVAWAAGGIALLVTAGIVAGVLVAIRGSGGDEPSPSTAAVQPSDAAPSSPGPPTTQLPPTEASVEHAQSLPSPSPAPVPALKPSPSAQPSPRPSPAPTTPAPASPAPAAAAPLPAPTAGGKEPPSTYDRNAAPAPATPKYTAPPAPGRRKHRASRGGGQARRRMSEQGWMALLARQQCGRLWSRRCRVLSRHRQACCGGASPGPGWLAAASVPGRVPPPLLTALALPPGAGAGFELVTIAAGKAGTCELRGKQKQHYCQDGMDAGATHTMPFALMALMHDPGRHPARARAQRLQRFAATHVEHAGSASATALPPLPSLAVAEMMETCGFTDMSAIVHGVRAVHRGMCAWCVLGARAGAAARSLHTPDTAAVLPLALPAAGQVGVEGQLRPGRLHCGARVHRRGRHRSRRT